MFYDRKIKYVNVYENGEKGQSAGFIKMEAGNDMVSLQVQVAGLRHTDTYNCPMVLMAGEKEFVIGELQLEKGKGIKEFKGLHLTDMGSQIGYEELEEIQIRMAGKRLLRCIVQERVRKMETSPADEAWRAVEEVDNELARAVEETNAEMVPAMEKTDAEMARAMEEETEAEIARTKGGEITEAMDGKGRIGVNENVAGNANTERDEVVTGKSEAELLKEAFLAEKRMREGEDAKAMSGEAPMQRQTPQANVMEPRKSNSGISPSMEPQNVHSPQAVDKWQQLLAIYPHIRPFEDRREYLMMKPQDFVILPQKYFSLADNSFLLHGYYNYDHLILSKEKRPEGEQMYIGVPGNFYDKEKQVAIMFGFESFEGKREPARMGDFGYYMIPVEI